MDLPAREEAGEGDNVHRFSWERVIVIGHCEMCDPISSEPEFEKRKECLVLVDWQKPPIARNVILGSKVESHMKDFTQKTFRPY